MSQIQQIGANLWQGPEVLGFTPHYKKTAYAAANYPGGQDLLHEPVHPGGKKIPLVGLEALAPEYDFVDMFTYFSAGVHEGYLDMRVNSVTNRGNFCSMGLFCLFVWWTFDFIVLSNLSSSAELMSQILSYGGYGVSAAIVFIPLIWPLVTPVRFHKKNQEVYVYHKRVLYRIPWDECEISIRVAQQNEGYRGLQDGYQLSIWLNAAHATNAPVGIQKYVELNLKHTMHESQEQYCYWEYIRRYMTGDGPAYSEITEEPKTPYPPKWGLIDIFQFIIFIPIGLVYSPRLLALLTPFKYRWPKEVHEWTGEKCNWH